MKKNFQFTNFDAIKLLPPLLKDGLIISLIVHIFLLVLIMISPHVHVNLFVPKVRYEEPILIDLEDVIVAKETVLPPVPAKPIEKKVEEVKEKNVPSPSSPKKSEEYFKPEKTETKTESQQENIETAKTPEMDFITEDIKTLKKEQKVKKEQNLAKERMGSLDDLLASVDGIKKEKEIEDKKEIKKEEKFTEVKKGISASSIESPTQSHQKNSTADYLRKQLSMSYIDAIRIKLRSCWNIDVGAKGIKDMKIVIRTTISPDGNISNIDILNMDNNSSPSFKAVAESARRALFVCSPYNLPVEYYQDWKSIVFTFYPDKQSVQ